MRAVVAENAQKFLVAAIALLSLTCGHAVAAGRGAESEILRLERARRDAQLRGDWQEIQKLNTPDFTEIAANGGLRTGAENSQAMRSGVLKFETVEYSDQQVRVYSDVAFVTGVATRTGAYDGKPFSQHFRYTRVYVRTEGMWRAAFAQNTRIEAGSQ